MIRHRQRKRAVAEINVVPYIDVMLVLLVIFMVTAPLLTQGVKVRLPEAQAKKIDGNPQQAIIVSIDASGNYYLNIADSPSQAMELEALLTRIAAEIALAEEAGHPRTVLVKGDRDVNYGKVVTAMAMLQKAGVNNVGLVTELSQSTT